MTFGKESVFPCILWGTLIGILILSIENQSKDTRTRTQDSLKEEIKIEVNEIHR